jgi:hypothetical protein
VSARRLVLPLAAVAVGLLALAPAGAGAKPTKKKIAPLVASAAFPGAGTQTWKAHLDGALDAFSGGKVTYRLVSRPTPSSVVFEARAKPKAPSHRTGRATTASATVACNRGTIQATLAPATGADSPLDVVRRLQPKAVFETYTSLGANGDLAGDGTDVRLAARVFASGKTSTESVVTDWTRGALHGWSEVTASSKDLAKAGACAHAADATVVATLLVNPVLNTGSRSIAR